MSAMGTLYLQACELAGLDLDDEASLDNVGAAFAGASGDATETLLLSVVAILRDGAA